MSKTSNTLLMLQLLNCSNIVKVQDLADRLGTNPRNIIEYKKELEYCGYYIESIPGKYGGYRLDKERILPALYLTDDEKDILTSGTNYLLSRNDFLLKDSFNMVMGKLFSSFKVPNTMSDYKIIYRFPLAMREEDLNIRFKVLQQSINNHTKVELVYSSQNHKEDSFKFDPYDLLMFNNSWFVIGWNEKYAQINYLKLNRIINFFRLEEKFRVLETYSFHDHIDEFGFKNVTRDWCPIKFMAKGKLATIISERVYGKDQVVEEIDPTHTIISVKMKSKEAAMSFIYSHIEQIEVLEPDSIRQEIYNLGQSLVKKYGSDKNEPSEDDFDIMDAYHKEDVNIE